MSAPDLRSALLDHGPTAEALRVTFGGAPVESVAALPGGRSGASVLKITVAGRPYVVRRVAEPSAPAQVERHFACMKMASARGVAPRVLFADAARGVSIAEYVGGPPVHAFLRDEKAVGVVAALFRALHEGPAFPRVFDVAGLIGEMQTARAARALAPPSVSLAMVEEIRAALAPHRREAPCHHDPNPGNLVSDGERIFLVDWDSACAGDPMYDLAAFGVFVRDASGFRERLLGAYLGRAPTDVERAQAVLSRVLALACYATLFEGLAPSGEAAPLEASVPDLATALASAAETGRALSWEPAWMGRVLACEAAREAATPAYAASLVALR